MEIKTGFIVVRSLVKIAFIAFLIVFSSCSISHLSTKEIKAISQEGIDAPMQISLTTNRNDSLLLRTPSKPIQDPTHHYVKHLAGRMLSTVTDPQHTGVGIAAPQVGINRNLILVQRFDKKDKPFDVIINPTILSYSDSVAKVTEGCLSIPDMRAEVIRPYSITVEYQDTTGIKKLESVSGYTARIFQHEIDHLNGILFPDRIKQP
jgi:peptide deformylase